MRLPDSAASWPSVSFGWRCGPAAGVLDQAAGPKFGSIRGRSRGSGAFVARRLNEVPSRATIPGTVAFVSYDPTARSTGDLLGDWAAVMRELRSRGVIRTNNNPVGDIAETIVHGHYGGERANFSQAGWDVKTAAGERIQVKSMRTTPTTTRKNLSPIRDREYDSIVVVLFDEEFQVTDGLKLTRGIAEELASWRAHVNGHVLYVNRLLADPRVEHVDLTDAYARLNAYDK